LTRRGGGDNFLILQFTHSFGEGNRAELQATHELSNNGILTIYMLHALCVSIFLVSDFQCCTFQLFLLKCTQKKLQKILLKKYRILYKIHFNINQDQFLGSSQDKFVLVRTSSTNLYSDVCYFIVSHVLALLGGKHTSLLHYLLSRIFLAETILNFI